MSEKVYFKYKFNRSHDLWEKQNKHMTNVVSQGNKFNSFRLYLQLLFHMGEIEQPWVSIEKKVWKRGQNINVLSHIQQFRSRKLIDWIDWMGFNAVFNNFSVISRRPVHLLMRFLVFSNQYTTQHTFQASGYFFT